MATVAEMEMQIKQLEDDFYEAFAKQYTWFDDPSDLRDYLNDHKNQIKKIQDKINQLKLKLKN